MKKMQDVWEFIKSEVFTRNIKTPNLFNQYYSSNNNLDVEGAAEIRQNNLNAYIKHFKQDPKVLFIGEAPGWRGCRFSGVPFTSEFQLCSIDFPFHGKKSSQKGPYKEPSASIFWQYLNQCSQNFFIWNALPFHPCGQNPLSNRTPKSSELEGHKDLLHGVIERLEPKEIYAIGRKAEDILKIIGVKCSGYIRHPSMGGKKEFCEKLKKIGLLCRYE